MQYGPDKPILNPDGSVQKDNNTGEPIMMPGDLVPTMIPVYKPKGFPLVLRRNITREGRFLGVSDVDIIADQQESVKKFGTKIEEKLLKGGSYAAVVCAPAEKKTAAFEDVLKAARAALQSDRQHSSVLNDRHWAVLTDRAREIIGATAQREPTEEEQKAASTAAQKAAAAEWYRTHRWNGTTWERRA